MKKIYLIAIAGLAYLGSYAQTNLQGVPVRTFSRSEISPSTIRRQEVQPFTGVRNVLLSENFQGVTGPYPAAIPTGWTTAQVTAADNSTVPSFKVQTSITANAGGYWSVPETGATNGSNKFAGVNDDASPCDCTNLNAWLQTPAIDFTSTALPVIVFDIFHDKNFGGGDAQLQASTDGVTFNNVPVDATTSVFTADQAVWQTIVIPLQAFAGQSNVSFRFQWTDGGNWASGFAVDNVVIGDWNGVDLKAEKVVFGDWNRALVDNLFDGGVWDYSKVPLTQTDTIRVTAVIGNLGSNAITNVGMSAAVTANGSPITGSPFASGFTTAVLPSLSKDTLSATTNWVPSALGTIVATCSVTSDSTDANPANNSGSATMEITQYLYARDPGAAAAFVNPQTAYVFGNLFQINNNDQFSRIEVAIGRQSDATTGADLSLGATVNAQVFEFTGFDATTGGPLFSDVLFETEQHVVTAADYNQAGTAIFTNLYFVNANGDRAAITLDAGKIYLVAFQSVGDVRVAVCGNNQWAASWLNDGTTWGATGSIPMIRLNSDESLNVAENKTIVPTLAFSVSPNPASDFTQITYNLNSASRVNVTLRDLTGRIVAQQNEGLRMAGTNTTRVNLESLSSGIYTITLSNGSTQYTSRVIVR